MPRKTYIVEFKRDAVALYEDVASTSLKTIATVCNWSKEFGTGALNNVELP